MGSYKNNCAWGNRGFVPSSQETPSTAQAKTSGNSTYDKALAGVQQHSNIVDEALLKVLAKNYAITQTNPDAASVACSDSSELDTVVNNFAVKKLGMQKDAAIDAVKGVCEEMASSKQKNRIVFYYLLTKKVGKESVFV